MSHTDEYDSESIHSSSDSISNASSISLGVNQEEFMHTQPNSEAGDNDTNEQGLEGGAVIAHAPVPFTDLVVNSPEFLARAYAAGAEIQRYRVAHDAMEEQIARLDVFNVQDRTESEERFPNMEHLHHVNYHLRLDEIMKKCAAVAGPGADPALLEARVARILAGLPVPPIEEEVQAQVVEE